MFQPRVKLEFARRYCAPKAGWSVCVDIDPSEEGRTGTKRESKSRVSAKLKCRRMLRLYGQA